MASPAPGLKFKKNEAVLDDSDDIKADLHQQMGQNLLVPGNRNSHLSVDSSEDISGLGSANNRPRTSSHNEQMQTFSEILIDNVSEGLRAVEEQEELLEQKRDDVISTAGSDTAVIISGDQKSTPVEPERETEESIKLSGGVFTNREQALYCHEQCVESLRARCLFFDENFGRAGSGVEEQLMDYLDDVFCIGSDERDSCVRCVASGGNGGLCYLPASLEVTLVRARNLAGKDRSGKSDPYCGVSLLEAGSVPKELESYDYETKVIEQDLNPVWEETFRIDFDKTPRKSQIVLIDVFDFDEESIGRHVIGKMVKLSSTLSKEVRKKNDFLGRVEVNLGDINPFDESPKWFKLQQRSSRSSVCGDIMVKFRTVSWMSSIV